MLGKDFDESIKRMVLLISHLPRYTNSSKVSQNLYREIIQIDHQSTYIDFLSFHQ